MKPTALHRATPKARSSASFLTHIAGELCRYDAHLRRVRGLAAATRKDRLYVAGLLLPLARLHEPDIRIQRYRAPDSMIDFLKTL